MCIPLPQLPPPNERCRRLVKALEGLCLLEIALSGMSMFVSYDLFFYMIFSAIILYLGYTQLDVCSMFYYIFFSAIQLFAILIRYGTYLQTGQPEVQYPILFVVFSLILMIFNTVAIAIAARAFGEFRKITLEQRQQHIPPPLRTGLAQQQGYGAVGKKIVSLDKWLTFVLFRGKWWRKSTSPRK